MAHRPSNGGKPNVNARLKGVHKVKSRLADGTTTTYFYAWRGGPRIDAAPGTPEFIRLYGEAHAARKKPPTGIVLALVAEYRASAEFQALSPSSQKAYRSYLRLIEDEFGDMPIAALAEPEVRGVFKRWRDGFAATPRKADYLWVTLARMLSVAKDRGRIAVNPCERGGRLYQADRAESVWTADEIGAFCRAASPELQMALLLALWTGQRQGDLLALSWTAYDGRHIRLRQGKGGRRVTIPVGEPLKAALDAAKAGRKGATTILVNTRGMPWTGDGFRASWGKACARAQIDALHFHDLRGTAVTRLAIAGCTTSEIATITGHSHKDAEAILDAHYLGRTIELAESAIGKLSARYGSGTKTVK